MRAATPACLVTAMWFALGTAWATPAHADGSVKKVNHIIIVMQENHSFDNYFGALPYAPGGPYHNGPCDRDDHGCVGFALGSWMPLCALTV